VEEKDGMTRRGREREREREERTRNRVSELGAIADENCRQVCDRIEPRISRNFKSRRALLQRLTRKSTRKKEREKGGNAKYVRWREGDRQRRRVKREKDAAAGRKSGAGEEEGQLSRERERESRGREERGGDARGESRGHRET